MVVKKEKWMVAQKKADFAGLGAAFGIDPVTVRLIRNRNVIGKEAVREYLHGSLLSLHAPKSMRGLPEAVEFLLEKIREKKKIRIIGDYDIDGVNATYILYTALKKCGALVDYEIPDRMKDGYGLNVQLVDLAAGEGVDTILTCDNGIAAIPEIAHAKSLGMTVLVTDHHEPLFVSGEDDPEADVAVRVEAEGKTFRLPPADVVVNPHQPLCPYPYKKLCGAAVAWKLICLLYERTGHSFAEAEELLPFAGFATIGDVMDLDGENRILAREGLKRLHATKNLGLRALISANELVPQQIESYHIGFVLGPCINASGRLDTAKRSLRLLLSDSVKEAEAIAGELKALNDERKALTKQAAEEAFALIDTDESYQRDRVLVIYLPDCHESIAGIVAGRVRERYYKPTFVLTNSGELAKGSGRSIEAYSMFEELVRVGDLFTRFGGHPMAAGFSLERGRVQEMRERLNANCTLTEDELTEKVAIDVPMPIDYITERRIEELSLLEPFGKGNEKPLFADRKLRLLSGRVLGKNRNVLKLQVMNAAGAKLDAMYFGEPENMLEYLRKKYSPQAVETLLWGRDAGMELDMTYYPSVNEYMGKKSLQIVIKNFR